MRKNVMNEANQVRLATLLLRVTLGAMYLAHSVILKGFIYGLPGTAQFFQSLGLPGPLAYVVFGGEALGGVLLLAGIATRVVSLSLVPILIGAGWAHLGNGWVFSNQGGGWEYPLFLIIASIVLALLPQHAAERGIARKTVPSLGAAG
jgi:putative oxidoreductase